MTQYDTAKSSQSKDIRAWAIRRREVDINQLALAYYLLARIRIEEQRQDASNDAADARTERRSEAA